MALAYKWGPLPEAYRSVGGLWFVTGGGIEGVGYDDCPGPYEREGEMAAIPYNVAEAFTRKAYARSGAFVSHGQEVYSYGMRLAHWEDGKIVFDYERGSKGPSVTTSRHMRALEAVVQHGRRPPTK